MQHTHSHGHNHGHEPGHHHGGLAHARAHAPQSHTILLGAMAMTGTVFVAEVIVGFLSGSLALLADSAHMLSDSAGMALALIAVVVGRRQPTARATFGYQRAEVLAATINAAAVGAIALWIVAEALFRLGNPRDIATGPMLIVAFIGLVANAIAALIVAQGQQQSLNMRGVYLHILSDLLGSVAVIGAAVGIRLTGWQWLDTAASIIIALLILPRSWQLLRQAVSVLLEEAPHGLSSQQINAAVLDVPGVVAVHDIHLWSIDGTVPMASCHVVVQPAAVQGGCTVLDLVQEKLGQLGVAHATVQVEVDEHRGHEKVCDIPTAVPRRAAG